MSRTAKIERTTKESGVLVEVDLDGTGRSDVSTGVGFYDHMLDAFARLDGEPTLDVAGDGVDRPALEEQARALGVADRVRFLGFLEEPGVVEVLARAQTLVLPSTEEVYGFTALEAQVAGLQVVVSSKAGIAENLVGVPGAWVVEPDTDGVLAGLEAARAAWTGWTAEIPEDAASPKRTADDVIAAAVIASS